MMRRTGWRTATNLSNKMEWEYLLEPEMLAWTVKALDRNVLFHLLPFVLPISISFMAFCVFLLKGHNMPSGIALAALVFALFLFYKVGMERTVFVYRATCERLEIFQWQDISDLEITFLRVFPFIATGIIAMAFINNPVISIAALAGPALVAVLVGSVGSASSYKAAHKRFRQRDFKWEDIDRAMLDVDKGILALSISSPDNCIHDHEIDFEDPAHHRYLTRIYFDKTQERQVLELFKKKMPDRATMVERSYKFAFAERS